MPRLAEVSTVSRVSPAATRRRGQRTSRMAETSANPVAAEAPPELAAPVELTAGPPPEEIIVPDHNKPAEGGFIDDP